MERVGIAGRLPPMTGELDSVAGGDVDNSLTASGRRAVRGSLLLVVDALSELLDHLRVERAEIRRFAARDEPAIDMDLCVDPCAAGVPDVSLQARPRRERPGRERRRLR